MLESEVNHEENQSKDHSSDHNQKGRALKLFPGWPRDLLGEFYVTFDIIGRGSRIRTHIDGFGDR